MGALYHTLLKAFLHHARVNIAFLTQSGWLRERAKGEERRVTPSSRPSLRVSENNNWLTSAAEGADASEACTI